MLSHSVAKCEDSILVSAFGLHVIAGMAASILQKVAPSNATAAVSGKPAVGVPLLVGLPVLLVVVTAVVVLLLFLVWLNYKSRNKDQAPSPDYRRLPTHDIGPVMNLPYPTASKKPKIEMMDPPVPGTTTEFVEAAQLGLGGSHSSRYPFTDTDHSTSSSEKEKKKPRRGSRRSRAADIKFRSSDRSSGSEDGSGSPRRVPGSRSAGVTPPPSPVRVHRSSRDEKVVKSADVFLSLAYNESEALLVVKVEKATELPYRADGTPVDAYVRLFFIPKLPELPQRRTNKTKTQRRDNSPVFNEVVVYEAMSAEELINSNLHLEVLDYRSYGKHVVLGQADIPLIQVQFVRGEASITLPLKLPKVGREMGRGDGRGRGTP